MLEKDLEKKLVKAVKEMGGKAYKFTSQNNSGVPDRIVIIPTGELFFVEMKTDNGRLSILQEFQMRTLRRLKQSVFVIKGELELDNFVSMLKNRVEDA